MVGVKDVPAEDFIAAYAEHLQDKLELPEWVDLVKTAYFKELCPITDDWYFVRAASICRKLYFRQDIGVGMFRKIYGGKNKRWVQPSHFTKSSGGLIRLILQQLEELGFVEKSETLKGGRRLTKKGQSDMDLVATRVEYTPIEL